MENLEKLAGLKVEIFVQDLAEHLAGQEEGTFLTLPMEKDDLAKALEPYKGEEMNTELVDFDIPASFKSEKEALEVGELLHDALYWMTYHAFNVLVKALSAGDIEKARKLL